MGVVRVMGASPGIVPDDLWERIAPPQELGFGSGMTCWRRPRDRNEAGVRQQLHGVLPAELTSASRAGQHSPRTLADDAVDQRAGLGRCIGID